ncbi:MAG: methyl-accepting chemotaxis protein, partial [Fibromonadaceae bacterium]|nr:methyl-accepting chemotaxis protein [Fibromonadaceae bacterium]
MINFLRNIKVGPKLITACIIVSLAASIPALYMSYYLHEIDDRDTFLFENGIIGMSSLAHISEYTQELRIQARRWQAAANAEERAVAVKIMEESYIALKKLISEQIERTGSQSVKNEFTGFQGAIDRYMNEIRAYISNMEKSNKFCPNTGRISEDFHEAVMQASDDLIKYGRLAVEHKIEATKEYVKESSYIINSVRFNSLFAIPMVFFLCLCVSWYLTVSITKPLKATVSGLNKIKNGDMTVRLNIDRGDEIGIVATSLDEMTSKLQGIMAGLHKDSDFLAKSSKDLSGISNQLSVGAEETVNQSNTVASTTEQMAVNINAMASGAEQASVNANEVAGAAEEMSTNMNTIAAAVEELSISINQIASNTSEVRKVATEATGKAGEATGVMNKLGSAAKEIGQVTDVI